MTTQCGNQMWQWKIIYHWIGFVGKIYRKPWFLPSNLMGFPVNFPIIQFYESINGVLMGKTSMRNEKIEK